MDELDPPYAPYCLGKGIEPTVPPETRRAILERTARLFLGKGIEETVPPVPPLSGGVARSAPAGDVNTGLPGTVTVVMTVFVFLQSTAARSPAQTI